MLYPSFDMMIAAARRRRQRVLRLYRRPDGTKTGRTLAEIGDTLGVNRQRVWQMIKQAERDEAAGKNRAR